MGNDRLNLHFSVSVPICKVVLSAVLKRLDTEKEQCTSQVLFTMAMFFVSGYYRHKEIVVISVSCNCIICIIGVFLLLVIN